MSKPKGILRNAPPEGTYKDLLVVDEKFDRQKVLENTKRNASLHGLSDEQIAANSTTGTTGQEPLRKLSPEEKDLKWDEAKLIRDEMERTATMKIDEPKTPYQGPAGLSEYYKDDDTEDVEDFSLGEPEVSVNQDTTIENDRIVETSKDEDEEDVENSNDTDSSSEDGEESVTPEEKHRRFEEMRKAHYKMKGDVLKKPMLPVEEDE